MLVVRAVQSDVLCTLSVLTSVDTIIIPAGPAVMTSLSSHIVINGGREESVGALLLSPNQDKNIT